MGVPINNVTRRVVYAASGTGPYAFTFEILAAGDIAVYRDDTLLTITTDYTVTIASNGTGSITLTAAPTGATQIAIVGNRTISRTTDFVTGGDFFANVLNDELDQQTIFNQQNAEGLQRALQAPQTDPTSINMTLPRAALRANKALGFDANGNPTIADTLGTNRGNWAASTLYYVRDIVKDTTNSNIWQCIVQHTSSGSQPISTNTDAAKWTLLVDAAAAATSATNAANSATAAASSASAASTSATNAASSASSASTSASNASTSATNAANSATTAAGHASTASTQATNAASSASAASTSATNAASSASAASSSASSASTSATNAASSASAASTSATNASNSASTATTQATNASTSASNAATSATNAANSATSAQTAQTAAEAALDSFDDRYLGAKTANPTLDNDGNALLTGALYFNSVANEMRVYTGSAWQALPTLPDLTVEKSFKATAGQTSYTFTGGYRVGFTYVWVNGALLYSDEITATNGTTITFATALTLDDEVRILTFKAVASVTAADVGALPLTGGTLTGAVTARAANAIRSEAAATQDAVVVAGRAGGTGSFAVTLTPATLASNTTLTLPNVTDTVATIGSAQTFTAAQIFRASNAIRSEAASAQDAVVVAGRAGGTSSFAATITPATLSANRTVTLPDANTTIPVATQTLTLSGPTAARTLTLPDENFSVGYLNIPQNSQSAAYTLVLGDSGKHILHPSADTTARTFTIPANSSVAFPVGTAVTFINQNGAGSVTISITTDTMRLAGAGTTGSRTLAANGVATAIKITSTEWIISGSGLT